MADATPALMSKVEYARHRGVSPSYITKLLQNGILVMRGKKVDVRATDKVLDDKPLPPIEEPEPGPVRAAPSRQAFGEAQPGQQRTSYAEARTIKMVFDAKLARLQFETKQGKLIEAETVRLRISEHVRALRDGLLGLPDRLSSTLAAESDPRKVHVLLKTEISRELEALANAFAG